MNKPCKRMWTIGTDMLFLLTNQEPKEQNQVHTCHMMKSALLRESPAIPAEDSLA